MQDVNDQAPVFTTPPDAYVLENLPQNTIVTSITTVDLDEGENSNVEYFLTNSDSDKFSLGRLDGILRTTSSLDREGGGEVAGCGGGDIAASSPGVRVPQLDPGLVSPFNNLQQGAM